MKRRISFLVFLMLLCSVAYADVVDLISNHGGLSIVGYELSWLMCFGFIALIIFCCSKNKKEDTKIFLKIFLIGAVVVFVIYVAQNAWSSYKETRGNSIEVIESNIRQNNIYYYNNTFTKRIGEKINFMDTTTLLNRVNICNSDAETVSQFGEIYLIGINDSKDLEERKIL